MDTYRAGLLNELAAYTEKPSQSFDGRNAGSSLEGTVAFAVSSNFAHHSMKRCFNFSTCALPTFTLQVSRTSFRHSSLPFKYVPPLATLLPTDAPVNDKSTTQDSLTVDREIHYNQETSENRRIMPDIARR